MNKQLTVRPATQLERIAKDGSQNPIKFIHDIPNQKSIRQLQKEDSEALSKALGYLFTIIPNILGIKEPTSDVNKVLIKELLFKIYPNISLEQIYFAFKMDLFRQFGEPAQHYQLFNAQYLAEVLDKYKRWLKKTKIEKNIVWPLAAPKQEMSEEDKHKIVKKGVQYAYDTYCTTGQVEVGYNYVYDYLVSQSIMPTYNDAIKKKIRERALKATEREKKETSAIAKFRKGLEGPAVETEYKRQMLMMYFEELKNKHK